MIQRTTGGLDAVDHGPLPSDSPKAVTKSDATPPGDHPAVGDLVTRFGSAIRKHRIHAGDQLVVWIDPSRSVEILGWLKDDPTQRYDMMSDVTGVDYGKGAVDVVYQMFSTAHKRALRVRCELPYAGLRIGSVGGIL